MKKLMSAFLAAILLFAPALPVGAAEEGGYSNFKKTADYADGVFSDVPADAWYRDSVAAVYELGLMRGADGAFRPGDSVTLGEAVALAARLHRLYHTGEARFDAAEPWYAAYVDYAARAGIVRDTAADWTARADRATFAGVLARALPEGALPAVNDVADGQIPDVSTGTAYAEEIYRLYRAGVLTGSNAYGTFAPGGAVDRASAATILARMAYRSLRQRFALEELRWPDLPERGEAPAGYFSNAAMLGNSLVQGMQLYSGLEGMRFVCYQSVTVLNADSYVDELCQRQHDRVYIEYGVNEIYMDTDAFAAAYGKIIDRIRAAMPEAEIYVMALTPVTAARSSAGTFTMSRIRAFNAALRALAEEKECWYLDCCETLCDDTGYLVESYAGWDGSPHLSEAGYVAWADVIRTHYA